MGTDSGIQAVPLQTMVEVIFLIARFFVKSVGFISKTVLDMLRQFLRHSRWNSELELMVRVRGLTNK